jgi:hypothetical protein
MKKFSIPQVAFSGYRLLAARPGVALAWFVFQLVVALGLMALMVVMAGPELTALRELRSAGTPPDPATTMALSGKVMGFGLVSLLLYAVLGAVSLGAVSRAVLRPAESKFAYLRFGADELRLLAVIVVLGILLYVAYFVALLPAMAALFAVAGMERAAMAMQGVGSMPAGAIGAAVLAALPGAILLVFLTVKLALAPAQTVAKRQISFFGSWGLTKGVFWRSLGAYILSAIPVLILVIVALGVAVAVHPGGLAGGLQAAMQPDVSSLAAAFSPLQVLVYVLNAVAGVASMAGLIAPPAAIYAAIALRSDEAMA